MPAGRPKEPVPKVIADALVIWISDGKTLREFCRQPEMPSYGTIYNWEKKDPEFAERIACARDIGEEVLAQECLAIADDGTNDYMEETHGDDEDSSWRFNGENVQRSRLRIETRLKLLAKWNPKKYGEKLEHTGDIGIKTVIVPATAKSEDARPERKPDFEKE